jgi:uncharacterized protein
MPESLTDKRDRLLQLLKGYGTCAVAYSGGVDSAVVAKAARLALGDAASAITGHSAALADGELKQARQVANLIGIRHVIVDTDEFANPLYVANQPDRCFHCKAELYEKLRAVASQLGASVLANGAIVDDLGDFRPGMRAAADFGVRSPLVDCELSKLEVRQLAAEWELPVADKPATPCLSSRIAYGQEVTSERLAMIDRAEQLLRSLGFRELRVRYHGDGLARIEVPLAELDALCQPDTRARVVAELGQLGFKFVTLDLAGFRSGSFAALVPAEAVKTLA